MRILTSKRFWLIVVALGLATSALANRPSPRTAARMAFDEQAGMAVLFGGRGVFDGATQVTHDSDETWLWNGTRWLQRFPESHPPGRASHGMVYDSKRGRIVVFGGRIEAPDPLSDPTFLGDTWVWQNDDWTQLDTLDAPSPRQDVGMAYDRKNDRIVLFGGSFPDAKGVLQPISDTWEFDGDVWTQVGGDQPHVANPVLQYDATREETIMMGVSPDDGTRLMFRYDADAKSWSPITPETLPTCVNGGSLLYQPDIERLLFIGGTCGDTTPSDEQVFEWDGSDWSMMETTNSNTRGVGRATAYDIKRGELVSYGGSYVFTTSLTSTVDEFSDRLVRKPDNEVPVRMGTWTFGFNAVRPAPRSLFVLESDPLRGNAWLFGGLAESSDGFMADLWGYGRGQWYPLITTDGPDGSCATPVSAMDTDRGRLVVVCSGSTVYELNSSDLTWKSFPDLKKAPDTRQWGRLVYDKNLKKTVLFGGFGPATQYRHDTWTWDGTAWTEVKGDRPEERSLMAMWFDPLLQRTVIYGGIGRPNLNSKITRYDDMWAFTGTGWTKLSPSQTPGQRLGAQIVVEPESGKVLLFGGLRFEEPEGGTATQFYTNDTWEWDGSTNTWTELHPTRIPEARENGMLVWDPAANQIVLFAGYSAGFYLSDTWLWDGQNWTPLLDIPVRRRPSG